MGSGDLPGGGFWFDKDVGADKRRICSAIQTKTHMVSCSYLVPAAKADIALETCKSLRPID
jgi:hypothetical protein